MAWYTLPFRPGLLIDGQVHPRQRNIEQAIQEHVSVLLRTVPGEAVGGPEYGCHIWDRMAEPVRGEAWLAQFKMDVEAAIKTNEPRLTAVQVEVCVARSAQGANELTLAITGRTQPGDRAFRYSRVVLTDPIRIH